MYKLVEPFEVDNIYYKNKKDTIREIYKILKSNNFNNPKFKIKDLKTGKEYSYIVMKKRNKNIKNLKYI